MVDENHQGESPEVKKVESSTERNDKSPEAPQPEVVKKEKKGWKFAIIIVALALTGLLTALEITITSTALPSISHDLQGEDLYIWAVNSYTLAMYPILAAVALFILGSGICGGANDIATLIAGRAVQGIGSGGINVLIEIIVCDLVPLRERGQYLGLVMGLNAVGTAGGPIFGGLIVSYTSWRWIFYMNLPLGGAALAMLIVFLQVHHKKDKILLQLARIDWIGNLVFIAAVVSVLLALSMAGTKYSWSSWQIIVPLVLGLAVGFPLFLIYEGCFCVEPIMPLRLFTNRTSLIAFILTLLHGILTVWAIYWLPIYFQGVKVASPARSGVMLIPIFLLMLPFVLLSGKALEVWGRYKPIHILGCAILTIGFGLFSLLDQNSSTAAWVLFPGILACGVGTVVAVLLPAVCAPLPEADVALATSTWAFVRSFGLVWGVSIPAAIFNRRVDQLAVRIKDHSIASQLSAGNAYEHATKAFLDSLTSEIARNEVIDIFRDSLREVWYVGIAFAGLAFLLAFLEEEVVLRKDLETEYGMKENVKLSDRESVVSPTVHATANDRSIL